MTYVLVAWIALAIAAAFIIGAIISETSFARGEIAYAKSLVDRGCQCSCAR